MRAIAQPYRQRVAIGVDFEIKEQRPGRVIQLGYPGLQLGVRGDRVSKRKSSRLGHACEVHAACGVRGLHAGLGIQLIVDDHDRQILDFLSGDGGQRTQPHQHLTIAGNHQHAARGLRDGDSHPNHGCAAHAAPQVKGVGMIHRAHVITR